MSKEPTFRIRAKGKTATWFDPANDHTTTDFTDRPVSEEICLGVWEEAHGTGYAMKEIVISYRDLPALYHLLDKVVADAIVRLEGELTRLEVESDEYKAALHQADRETYMEIFTRRSGGSP